MPVFSYHGFRLLVKCVGVTSCHPLTHTVLIPWQSDRTTNTTTPPRHTIIRVTTPPSLPIRNDRGKATSPLLPLHYYSTSSLYRVTTPSSLSPSTETPHTNNQATIPSYHNGTWHSPPPLNTTTSHRHITPLLDLTTPSIITLLSTQITNATRLLILISYRP